MKFQVLTVGSSTVFIVYLVLVSGKWERWGDQQRCTVVFVCCVKAKNCPSAAFITRRPMSADNSNEINVNKPTAATNDRIQYVAQ